jgi:murein DD-endopeptidase MepM/ murein hydrolase activator NlpD
MNKKVFAVLAALAVVGAALLYYLYLRPGRSAHGMQVLAFLRDPQAHADWTVTAGARCEGAVFAFPTSGFIGYVWDDSFRIGHRHSGLDIFAGTDINVTPVVAAYDGYLTRLADWKSAVIIRIPADPLHPDRQIWTYYAHMADEQGNSFISPQFPPGTSEVFVKAGTLLGYQGDYSGDPLNPVGVHLHFSIVKDDGQGRFTNETDFQNTYDPSPYFNLRLNSKDSPDEIPVCATP